MAALKRVATPAEATRLGLDGMRLAGLLPPMAGAEEPQAPSRRSLDELIARNDEIRVRLQEIDNSATGRPFSDEERDEWNRISVELEGNETAIDEMERRKRWLEDVSARTGSREEGAHFGVRPARSQPAREDIWDLTTMRGNAMSSPEDLEHEGRERAMRAIEGFTFPHPEIQAGRVPSSRVREHLNTLLEVTREDRPGELAMHILRCGSPIYKRAFGKVVAGQPTSTDETRALAVASGPTGGYAVPITLDPTLIPTSNGTVNPFRKVARIETITGLEYRGLTTGAVTASYSTEGTEVADNSPTLAQPDMFVERCASFVPYSIEIGMDWNGLQAGMAKLIQDAKDVIEATKFTLGAGHGTNEPQGLLTGATSTVATGTSGAFGVADLYSLEGALPPRFRPLAQFFGNRFAYNQIRQFSTASGAYGALWQPLANPNTGPLGVGLENHPFQEGGNLGMKLIGYGANEVSDMPAALTHPSNVMVLGDPSYYLIVDRIGMTIELVPHLFGSNRRPTGQRGLFAYWRNTGAVVDPNAWRVLTT